MKTRDCLVDVIFRHIRVHLHLELSDFFDELFLVEAEPLDLLMSGGGGFLASLVSLLKSFKDPTKEPYKIVPFD
ncbi:hypothetical protein HDV05_007079 [Chytridiales sp. JEL 0842]|nr:hypothetical protein HDV05_007079 [Chytridiales sp. JEL 0842]